MLFRAPKSWSSDAACQRLSEEEKQWFYTEGGSGYKKAKAVCANCPARAECLDRAMDLEARGLGVGPRGDRFGVWGGLSGIERSRLAQERA
jgi:WhiB family transcriptional regulator, redox-sensing transcriptional regulator